MLTPSSGIVERPGATLAYVIEGEGRPCIIIGSRLYYPRVFSERFKKEFMCGVRASIPEKCVACCNDWNESGLDN